MDDDIPKQNCCKHNRKTFIFLIVTSILFFMLWNLNISNNLRMTENIFLTNISKYVYVKNVFTHPQPAAQTSPPLLNPHNFRYILQESSICDSVELPVFLMIVVCVAPSKFEQRKTIRETWGSVAKNKTDIRLIFMIGKTLNESHQEEITKESNTYRDVVQEDFIDSYRNLSYKSVAMLKWSVNYCPSARYILKADDDMYVNVEYLMNVLKHSHPTNSVIGFQINGARPIQDQKSKWYTPKEDFSGTVYPSYCSGTSYVISGDAIEKIYQASLDTPLFWLEDIYITGICRTKAKVSIVNNSGFTYDKPSPTGCVFKRRITGHRYTEREIRTIWKEINNSSIKCHTKLRRKRRMILNTRTGTSRGFLGGSINV